MLEKVRDPEIVRFEAKNPHTMTSSARKAYTHQKTLAQRRGGRPVNLGGDDLLRTSFVKTGTSDEVPGL